MQWRQIFPEVTAVSIKGTDDLDFLEGWGERVVVDEYEYDEIFPWPALTEVTLDVCYCLCRVRARLLGVLFPNLRTLKVGVGNNSGFNKFREIWSSLPLLTIQQLHTASVSGC